MLEFKCKLLTISIMGSFAENTNFKSRNLVRRPLLQLTKKRDDEALPLSRRLADMLTSGGQLLTCQHVCFSSSLQLVSCVNILLTKFQLWMSKNVII